MPYPVLEIDLRKIQENTRFVLQACAKQKVEIVGVTKSCLGEPLVAKMMIAGGARAMADSRIKNLRRLAEADLGVPLMMIRPPMLDEAEEVVSFVDISLVSSTETARALALAAAKLKKRHSVILMIETGDLRDGVLPIDALGLAKRINELPELELLGVGTNVACLQGAVPSASLLRTLVTVAEDLRRGLGIELPVISGGNSSALKLVLNGDLPVEVNQLRLGEALLLGRETVESQPIAGTEQDAFRLTAEVIEARRKPVPFAHDASPPGMAWRNQAVIAIGTQDIGQGTLYPTRDGLRVLKRSSDHLVVEMPQHGDLVVGDTVTFLLDYEALLAIMTSPFVRKQFIRS